MIGSKKFQLSDGSVKLYNTLTNVIKSEKYPHITNPCQPDYVRFLTYNGYKQLKDINIGDIIWTGYRWSKLTKKWSTGIKQVYRYLLSTNTYLDMTSNHRIVQNGSKIEIKDAEFIDRCDFKPSSFDGNVNDLALLAGLVLGDGSQQKNGGTCAYLNIGYKDQEMEDAVSSYTEYILDGDKRLAKLKYSFEDLYLEYLPTYERYISDYWKESSFDTLCKFLRGLYTANGSVVADGTRVTFKTASKRMAQDILELLENLGFRSYITVNKPTLIEWDNGFYKSKESYDVNTANVKRFYDIIGFEQKYKMDSIDYSKMNRKGKKVYIKDIEYLGEMEVFDYTVEAEEHTVMQKGFLVSNCGEISLNMKGGYCVLGNIVPLFCDTLEDVKRVAKLAARFLIRTNLMDSIYSDETKRTNRIGVGLIGIHEFAWMRFGYGFRDLINEEKSQDFWNFVAELRDHTIKSAYSYCDKLGLSRPHTVTSIQPAGTVAKIFGLTEGAHLPAHRLYLRNVQIQNNDPLLIEYKTKGYRVRELLSYPNVSIVSFPTKPFITTLNMGDKLVIAEEATPEEQYKWLMLLEKYWIGESGNQVSYTMKFDLNKISLQEFKDTLLKYQSQIRCCSVLPSLNESSKYEYMPEEEVNEEDFDEMVKQIQRTGEMITERDMQCLSGACPL